MSYIPSTAQTGCGGTCFWPQHSKGVGEEEHAFKVILKDAMSYRPPWAARDPVSTNKPKPKKPDRQTKSRNKNKQNKSSRGPKACNVKVNLPGEETQRDFLEEGI